MNDGVQAEPPRPNPTADQDEYYAVDLRKPQTRFAGWLWVIVAVPLLLFFTCGLGTVVFFLLLKPQSVQQPPVPAVRATARAVPMPIPAPQPGEKRTVWLSTSQRLYRGRQ